MLNGANRPCPARRSRGLSLIELLVGIVVGLFLVIGALRFFTDYLDDNRRLLLETRISQDLRAVTDLIARDLRRAGYWSAPSVGVTVPPEPNRYDPVTVSTNPTTLEFSYSRDALSPTAENNAVDGYERLGYRLTDGAIESRNGAGANDWRPLTETKVMQVTTFNVVPVRRCVSLSNSCSITGLADACTSAGAAYPKLWIRRYEIELVARATGDSRIVRRIVESARVRNDEIENPKGCPP